MIKRRHSSEMRRWDAYGVIQRLYDSNYFKLLLEPKATSKFNAMPYKFNDEGLEDGWSLVRTKNKKGERTCIHSITHPPVIEGLTLDKLVQEYEKLRKVWLGTACRKELLAILKRAEPDDGWKVDTAIALALGNFSLDYDYLVRQRSLWQLIAFVDIVDFLQLSSPTPIKKHAQEPRFNALDAQLLLHLHITVLEDPQARDLITPTTFTYVPYLEWLYEVEIVLADRSPRLHMGNRVNWSIEQAEADVALEEQVRLSRRETLVFIDVAKKGRWALDVLLGFKKRYQRMEFPRFEVEPYSFESFSIYWEAPVEEEEE